MRKGLRLFECFDKCYIEVCVPDKDRQRFEHEYGLRVGEKTEQGLDGYHTRKRIKAYNAWGIEFRIYFKTKTNWLIESLKKLGFHTEVSDKLIAVEFINAHPEHGYTHRITNQELFWWLVDYGYRLGENAAIPFGIHLLREVLREMRNKKREIIPTVIINQRESEDPIFEAKLFGDVA